MTEDSGQFNKRIFIACPIQDPEALKMLTRLRKSVAFNLHDIDFTWEEHPHITLRFIGSVDFNLPKDTNHIEGVRLQLQSLAQNTDAFRLALSYLHIFEDAGVLWCGIVGEDGEEERLGKFAKSVDEIVLAYGFSEANFSFSPHITLGRYPRKDQERVQNGIRGKNGDRQPLLLDTVSIMESVRDDRGWTHYERVFEMPSLAHAR